MLIVIYKFIKIFLISFHLLLLLFRSSDDGPVHSLVDLLTIDSCQTVLVPVVPDVDEVAVCCVCPDLVAVAPNDVLEVRTLITRLEMMASVVESGRVEGNPEVLARLMGRSLSDR